MRKWTEGKGAGLASMALEIRIISCDAANLVKQLGFEEQAERHDWAVELNFEFGIVLRVDGASLFRPGPRAVEIQVIARVVGPILDVATDKHVSRPHVTGNVRAVEVRLVQPERSGIVKEIIPPEY